MDYRKREYETRKNGIVVYYTNTRAIPAHSAASLHDDFLDYATPDFLQFLATKRQGELRNAGFDNDQIGTMAAGMFPRLGRKEQDPWVVVPVVDHSISGHVANPHSPDNLCLVRQSAAIALRSFTNIQVDPFAGNETRTLLIARPTDYVCAENGDRIRKSLAEDRYMAVLESSHTDLRLRQVHVTKKAAGWGLLNENDKLDWHYRRAEFLALTTGTFPRTMERFGVDPIARWAFQQNKVAFAASRLSTEPNVHHIQPLLYGGDHRFGNISLMLNRRAEEVLHEDIDAQTRGWKVGDSGHIMLPVPPRPFCSWDAQQMRAELRAIKQEVVPIFGVSPVPSRARPSMPGEEIEKAAYLPARTAGAFKDPLGLDLNRNRRR